MIEWLYDHGSKLGLGVKYLVALGAAGGIGWSIENHKIARQSSLLALSCKASAHYFLCYRQFLTLKN